MTAVFVSPTVLAIATEAAQKATSRDDFERRLGLYSNALNTPERTLVSRACPAELSWSDYRRALLAAFHAIRAGQP